jgi:hypothetical protein
MIGTEITNIVIVAAFSVVGIAFGAVGMWLSIRGGRALKSIEDKVILSRKDYVGLRELIFWYLKPDLDRTPPADRATMIRSIESFTTWMNDFTSGRAGGFR